MNLYKVLAKSLGYELINRDGSPSLNFHIMDLIQLHEIDLVLDVGGNRGQFAKSLRNDGYSGDIHSFEPVKATFEEIQQASQADKKWTVHNFAMGEQQGQSTVNVTKSSDFASFLKPSDYGKERFKKNKVEYTEEVDINTVDNFLKSDIPNFESKRIFLKTDTQGFDLQVVKGAGKSIPFIHCLLSEISFIPIYDDMPHYIETLEAFESIGFSVSGFYPITRCKKTLSVIEMDCVMVNKAILQ
jgi:FkbM family methyltransferase|tara:strand:- start:365 stop:1093 length:729 start_codon:yes stop_codon:yes gene_type:complete